MTDDAPLSAAQILQVLPGWVIVFGTEAFDDAMTGQLIEAIEMACGHRKFVVVFVPDGGKVGVFTAEEIAARLRDGPEVERIQEALR